MAFRLTRSRPLRSQFRRIVRKELEAAVGELRRGSPSQDAIHEARKSVKKVRAILRLLRAELGSNYRSENARLRAAAHALSSVRDADSMLNTLETLHGRYPGVVTRGTLRTARPALTARKRAARRKGRRTLRRAAAALKCARQRLPRRVGEIGRFKAVHAGAVRSYRAARRSMRGLTMDGAAAEFHEWRKRVKDYWYDLRLFEGLHDAARGRVRSIGELEELLGDLHDLAVLHDQLMDGSTRYGNARTRALVLGAISRGETSLRRRALHLGHRTFAERPRHFEKSLRTWWEDR